MLLMSYVVCFHRHLEGFLEVPLPVRFIFLFLGPEDGVFDYQEVGSSMSSLMSNGVNTVSCIF